MAQQLLTLDITTQKPKIVFDLLTQKLGEILDVETHDQDVVKHAIQPGETQITDQPTIVTLGVNQTDQQSLIDQPIQPLIPVGPHVPVDLDIDGNVTNDNTAYDSDSDIMADSLVAPAPFTGRQTDNAEQWLKQFEYFCRYKGFDDARQAALFRMLMRESAADWLDTLPAEAVTADLKKAFTDRYKISEVMKYRSTKEVFSRRQQKTESIDQFVESMRKLGKVIAVDEKVILYACQSGLRPELAPYILQQKPDSLDALVEAGRMAEMTIMPPSESDSLQKITSVEEKVDRIVETLERKNSAPVDQPFQRQPRYAPPNWGQRQNFNQYRGPIDRPRSAYGYRPPTQGHSQHNPTGPAASKRTRALTVDVSRHHLEVIPLGSRTRAVCICRDPLKIVSGADFKIPRRAGTNDRSRRHLRGVHARSAVETHTKTQISVLQ